MSSEKETTELLFSYGTLQNEEVQLATFGRLLRGHTDTLVGYKLKLIPNQDQTFTTPDASSDLRQVYFTGLASDTVNGTVFTLSRVELEHADAYEPADFKRTLIRAKSGLDVWVYASVRKD